MGEIFGTDGIRDRAGHGFLAPDKLLQVGRAAGSLLRKSPARLRTLIPKAFHHLRGKPLKGAPGHGRVIIGRDTRASGSEIEAALAEGFQSMGADVGLAGVISTPGVATLTHLWGGALGVVISASHNPASDNGIKLISPQGFKIPDGAEDSIERLLKGKPLAGRIKKPKPAIDLSPKTSDYPDFLAKFCRPLNGMTIAIDCGHGAASAFAGPLFRRLGSKVILLNASPDGTNINAGCGALHPGQVAEAVRREKADIGVAFDGDADRAIFVDETGVVRDGETVLALCGLHLQERKKLPRNTIVSTVMANFGLERHLAAKGIQLKRTRVGDKFVAEEMLRCGAALGGEPSGHVLFFDAAPAGDGMLTALRVVDVLAERGQKLSQAAFPRFPQVLLNVKVARKPPLENARGIQAAVRAAEQELGADGRILVRYSGTEALCRVMVEGPREEMVKRLAAGVADAVQKELS
ncbi:MAG TPA: phosphoglucosamine mutase [Planctomycetota bacterium]|nr:phosphoglucosamine mutase [Planctomycetota bacterium]